MDKIKDWAIQVGGALLMVAWEAGKRIKGWWKRRNIKD